MVRSLVLFPPPQSGGGRLLRPIAHEKPTAMNMRHEASGSGESTNPKQLTKTETCGACILYVILHRVSKNHFFT
jgi:hypothetical protein